MKPIHTAPIVSTWLWYDVGSRNELPGKTGLSHWVEHMQFKGTRTYTAKEMEDTIARTGGYANAFTSPDWTTYFQTVPSAALEIALRFESDRMVNSLYEPEEVETERTVILSEREGNENDPQFLLSEAVQLAAFTQHPYRNEVLGSTEDLLSLTRDDLYNHYRNYYQPSNALLCLAGSFDVDSTLTLIKNYFESIKNQEPIRSIPTPETEITDTVSVELQGPDEADYIQIAWRSPQADDPDFFAYTLIESILSGPSSLSMFGSGGIGNRSSRFYRELVENQLVASVYGSLSASIDPGTFSLNLTCRGDHSPDQVIEKIDQVVDQFLTHGPTTEELAIALKQARANFTYSSDNITNQAFWLGYAHSFADYSWFTDYVKRLEQVSKNDILRVARQYLDPAHRVTGVYRNRETFANG
ncbi:MAG: insulinase family protein [Chloroflexi bacterium]|nr:insulinase family protein [Chloroflexota bacterium]